MPLKFEKVTGKDWDQIKYIYETGIETNNATFETQSPTTYDKWISNGFEECSYVIKDGDLLLGWYKLSPVSNRTVYAGVGEVSIYVHPKAKGKGVGQLLLNHLIKTSEENGFWTLQSSIFPENTASIQLHLKQGFREVGFREQIGKVNGIWRDNLLFERRSKLNGIK
ncbi:N-acetyltransferase [Psychrobacillus sp. INOP01]|uniref:GNAT family N-acetyltransferase n=1 Tax=Psychrobacillus sp. INOP01 TaxID=2829187 RepID=UPI001BABD459|nr:GNAT family N-acetyltransferase [Psychrobacillus sp. INOP01]QUG42037.1 N-acetyltransferase [Psychrobacillus sp. INOP01]